MSYLINNNNGIDNDNIRNSISRYKEKLNKPIFKNEALYQLTKLLLSLDDISEDELKDCQSYILELKKGGVFKEGQKEFKEVNIEYFIKSKQFSQAKELLSTSMKQHPDHLNFILKNLSLLLLTDRYYEFFKFIKETKLKYQRDSKYLGFIITKLDSLTIRVLSSNEVQILASTLVLNQSIRYINLIILKTEFYDYLIRATIHNSLYSHSDSSNGSNGDSYQSIEQENSSTDFKKLPKRISDFKKQIKTIRELKSSVKKEELNSIEQQPSLEEFSERYSFYKGILKDFQFSNNKKSSTSAYKSYLKALHKDPVSTYTQNQKVIQVSSEVSRQLFFSVNNIDGGGGEFKSGFYRSLGQTDIPFNYIDYLAKEVVNHQDIQDLDCYFIQSIEKNDFQYLLNNPSEFQRFIGFSLWHVKQTSSYETLIEWLNKIFSSFIQKINQEQKILETPSSLPLRSTRITLLHIAVYSINLILETNFYQDFHLSPTTTTSSSAAAAAAVAPGIELYLDSNFNIPFQKNSLHTKIWNSMIHYSSIKQELKVGSNDVFSLTTLSELLNGLLKNGDNLHPLSCYKIAQDLPMLIQYPQIDIGDTDIDISKIQIAYLSITLRNVSYEQQQQQQSLSSSLTSSIGSSRLQQSSLSSSKSSIMYDQKFLKNIQDICNYQLSVISREKNCLKQALNFLLKIDSPEAYIETINLCNEIITKNQDNPAYTRSIIISLITLMNNLWSKCQDFNAKDLDYYGINHVDYLNDIDRALELITSLKDKFGFSEVSLSPPTASVSTNSPAQFIPGSSIYSGNSRSSINITSTSGIISTPQRKQQLKESVSQHQKQQQSNSFVNIIPSSLNTSISSGSNSGGQTPLKLSMLSNTPIKRAQEPIKINFNSSNVHDDADGSPESEEEEEEDLASFREAFLERRKKRAELLKELDEKRKSIVEPKNFKKPLVDLDYMPPGRALTIPSKQTQVKAIESSKPQSSNNETKPLVTASTNSSGLFSGSQSTSGNIFGSNSTTAESKQLSTSGISAPTTTVTTSVIETKPVSINTPPPPPPLPTSSTPIPKPSPAPQTTIPASSIFANSSSSMSIPTSNGGLLFSSNTSSTNIFGKPSVTFESSTPSSSLPLLFGSTTSSTANSLFGSSTTTISTSTPTPTPTISTPVNTSLFNSSSSSITSTNNLFGASTSTNTAPSTNNILFGTPTTSNSLLNGSNSTTTPGSGLFGTPSSTSNGLFGNGSLLSNPLLSQKKESSENSVSDSSNSSSSDSDGDSNKKIPRKQTSFQKKIQSKINQSKFELKKTEEPPKVVERKEEEKEEYEDQEDYEGEDYEDQEEYDDEEYYEGDEDQQDYDDDEEEEEEEEEEEDQEDDNYQETKAEEKPKQTFLFGSQPAAATSSSSTTGLVWKCKCKSENQEDIKVCPSCFLPQPNDVKFITPSPKSSSDQISIFSPENLSQNEPAKWGNSILANTSPTSPTTSIFGNSSTSSSSVFSGSNTSSVFSGNNTSSVFSGNNTSSVFSGNNTSSVFSGSNTSSVFSGNNTSSIFGQKTTPVTFGTNTTSANQTSLFGSNTTTSPSSTSLFGNTTGLPKAEEKKEEAKQDQDSSIWVCPCCEQKNELNATQCSLCFASKPTKKATEKKDEIKPSTTPITFGSATPVSFGSNTPVTFGSATPSSTSLFGSNTPVTFSSSTTVTPSSTSLFGNATGFTFSPKVEEKKEEIKQDQDSNIWVCPCCEQKNELNATQCSLCFASKSTIKKTSDSQPKPISTSEMRNAIEDDLGSSSESETEEETDKNEIIKVIEEKEDNKSIQDSKKEESEVWVCQCCEQKNKINATECSLCFVAKPTKKAIEKKDEIKPLLFGSTTPITFGSATPVSFGSNTPVTFGSATPSSTSLFGSNTPVTFSSSTTAKPSSTSLFGNATGFTFAPKVEEKKEEAKQDQDSNIWVCPCCEQKNELNATQCSLCFASKSTIKKTSDSQPKPISTSEMRNAIEDDLGSSSESETEEETDKNEIIKDIEEKEDNKATEKKDEIKPLLFGSTTPITFGSATPVSFGSNTPITFGSNTTATPSSTSLFGNATGFTFAPKVEEKKEETKQDQDCNIWVCPCCEQKNKLDSEQCSSCLAAKSITKKGTETIKPTESILGMNSLSTAIQDDLDSSESEIDNEETNTEDEDESKNQENSTQETKVTIAPSAFGSSLFKPASFAAPQTSSFGFGSGFGSFSNNNGNEKASAFGPASTTSSPFSSSFGNTSTPLFGQTQNNPLIPKSNKDSNSPPPAVFGAQAVSTFSSNTPIFGSNMKLSTFGDLSEKKESKEIETKNESQPSQNQETDIIQEKDEPKEDIAQPQQDIKEEIKELSKDTVQQQQEEEFKDTTEIQEGVKPESKEITDAIQTQEKDSMQQQEEATKEVKESKEDQDIKENEDINQPPQNQDTDIIQEKDEPKEDIAQPQQDIKEEVKELSKDTVQQEVKDTTEIQEGVIQPESKELTDAIQPQEKDSMQQQEEDATKEVKESKEDIKENKDINQPENQDIQTLETTESKIESNSEPLRCMSLVGLSDTISKIENPETLNSEESDSQDEDEDESKNLENSTQETKVTIAPSTFGSSLFKPASFAAPQTPSFGFGSGFGSFSNNNGNEKASAFGPASTTSSPFSSSFGNTSTPLFGQTQNNPLIPKSNKDSNSPPPAVFGAQAVSTFSSNTPIFGSNMKLSTFGDLSEKKESKEIETKNESQPSQNQDIDKIQEKDINVKDTVTQLNESKEDITQPQQEINSKDNGISNAKSPNKVEHSTSAEDFNSEEQDDDYDEDEEEEDELDYEEDEEDEDGEYEEETNQEEYEKSEQSKPKQQFLFGTLGSPTSTTANTSASSEVNSTPTKSVFSQVSNQPSIFGSQSIFSNPSAPNSSSIFSTNQASSSSVFGTKNISSVFGNPPSSSVFGNPSNSTSNSNASNNNNDNNNKNPLESPNTFSTIFNHK